MKLSDRHRRLFSRRRRVYLDHAAASPLCAESMRAMRPFLKEYFANPSAIHTEGSEVREVIEDARTSIARLLRIREDEVFFTSGGTESNNLAVVGVLRSLSKTRDLAACEVVTTALEHPSLLRALEEFERLGVVVKRVPVDQEGRIDEIAFAQAVTEKTVLITYAYVNSEIGVVQDVKALSRIVRHARARHKSVFPYIHLDASQAPLYLSCAFDSLGVDLMTLDASKFCGPKGAGILAKRHHVALSPIMFGGDQEGGVRPGTESTASIVGAAAAFVRAQHGYEQRAQRLSLLRDAVIAHLLTAIDGSVLNGSAVHRIANNINISIPGIDGEYAAVVLDHHGYAVSTKSACSGATGTGSHVIYALGGDELRAQGTLRITLGEETRMRNIRGLVRVLKGHVAQMRPWKNIDQINKK